jgi:hypothetical protein
VWCPGQNKRIAPLSFNIQKEIYCKKQMQKMVYCKKQIQKAIYCKKQIQKAIYCKKQIQETVYCTKTGLKRRYIPNSDLKVRLTWRAFSQCPEEPLPSCWDGCITTGRGGKSLWTRQLAMGHPVCWLCSSTASTKYIIFIVWALCREIGEAYVQQWTVEGWWWWALCITNVNADKTNSLFNKNFRLTVSII